MEYRKIVTTRAVWRTLRDSHPDLVVFSSFSDPDGRRGIRQMMTEYGFKESPIPLIGAKTTWDISSNKYERVNESSEFWIFLPVEED